MLKCFKLFSTLLVLTTGLAFAHPCHPGGWEFTAEYLYVSPTVDDTYFVINAPVSSTNPSGTRVNNDFGFQSGFRVGGAYAFCDCNRELDIYYTRLGAGTNKTVTGNFLWATLGRADFAGSFENYTGTATSNLHTLYQRIDGIVAQQAWYCCGLNLYLQTGLEFGYMRLSERYNYTTNAGVSGDIDQWTRTWGGGPQLGLELDYDLGQLACFCPRGLTFVGYASSSLLASGSKARVFNSLSGATLLNTHDEGTLRIIPALHAKFGLNYGCGFSCFGLSLELGYEFNSYLRAISRVLSPDDVADGALFTNYYNFDVQGMYLTANVTF